MKNQISYTREAVNELIREFKTNLAMCDTDYDKQYYRGILKTYEVMIEQMDEAID